MQFSAFSNDGNYLMTLYETFYECEKEGDRHNLKLCAKIVRTLLISKMMVMISILLDDKNYNNIFAILEYDDSNLPPQEQPYIGEEDIFNNEMKPINSYRTFCGQSNHIILPGMDQQLINFIKMRFRFIFLKDYIFAICTEELLGLLHYRLVILNTTILECLLKSQAIKMLIENSYIEQENFSNF